MPLHASQNRSVTASGCAADKRGRQPAYCCVAVLSALLPLQVLQGPAIGPECNTNQICDASARRCCSSDVLLWPLHSVLLLVCRRVRQLQNEVCDSLNDGRDAPVTSTCMSDMSDIVRRMSTWLLQAKLQFVLCAMSVQKCSQTLDRADCQHALAHVCDGHNASTWA